MAQSTDTFARIAEMIVVYSTLEFEELDAAFKIASYDLNRIKAEARNGTATQADVTDAYVDFHAIRSARVTAYARGAF